jgi:hypothetical protein
MSNEEEEVTPSRTNTNKMIRVLTGKFQQKYTITVLHADGTVDEWQSPDHARVKWNDEARALWIYRGQYGEGPIMPWKEGDRLHCEENPDFKQ